MTALLPEGLRDRLPPFADAAAAIEARVLAAIGLHGYERVDPPLAEFADSLGTRLKAGALQDAVRFVDPVSQRTLALRPDSHLQMGKLVEVVGKVMDLEGGVCYALRCTLLFFGFWSGRRDNKGYDSG